MGNPHTHMRGVWLKGFSLVEKGRGGPEEDTPLLATKDKEECANVRSKVGSKENSKITSVLLESSYVAKRRSGKHVYRKSHQCDTRIDKQ